MPRIVVLDGFTLTPLRPGECSPEHPNWSRVAALGELEVYDRSPASEIAARLAGAEIALANKAPLPRETIEACPSLRYIGVMATGTNNVDLAAARERGIAVTNVPGYSAPSVVQTVFALLFEIAGRFGETSLAVRGGAWGRCPDFSFTLGPWRELAGKTLGVIGFGEIGERVARVGLALGMTVMAYSRTVKAGVSGVEWASFETLLERSDAISLHCPLTPETSGLINAAALQRMKRGAFLINTGRGPLVVESDVVEALRSGHLGGYGADVLCAEPPAPDNPLVTAPRSVITPHLAWASIEARARLMERVAENLEAFLAGAPLNLVKG